MTCAPNIAFAMLSHRGRVRRSNQDACAALPEHGAFVVCDGMGGAAGGEVASHMATEAFLNCLAQTGSATQARARLTEAIHGANQAVFRYSRKSPSLQGMGTTLVALLWEEAPASSTLWIAHVGDSRCYRLRSGTLQLLTRDHSLVEEQMRAGVLSQMQATASPLRNIITRAIGTQPRSSRRSPPATHSAATCIFLPPMVLAANWTKPQLRGYSPKVPALQRLPLPTAALLRVDSFYRPRSTTPARRWLTLPMQTAVTTTSPCCS